MAAQGALMIPIGFHGSDVFALLRSLSFFRSTCQGLMSAIIQPNANALLLRRFYSPTKPNLSFLVDRWRVTLLPRKSDRDQKSARVRQVRTPESLDPTSQSSLCSAGEPEKEEKMRREKII